MKFAVVDIETTGLFHQGHAITEIAVVHVDGFTAKKVFHSLVDPGRSIPGTITHITGINADTVVDAPAFHEIMPELLAVLDERIFVAHNVSFDFHFLKAQVESRGGKFNYKRLCTMRYARKVIPELRSYRLASLCQSLEVINSRPHRADGDALATADLLISLMHLDTNDLLDAMLRKHSNETILPSNISRESIDQLPTAPGVYYFYGNQPTPIYIGKASNLRRRVLSHFTSAGSSTRKQLFQREICKINFTATFSEYQALLLEDAEIRKHWPRYNVAQKDRPAAFAIVPYQNRGGLTRLAISRTKTCQDAIAWFGSYMEARNWIQQESVVWGFDPHRAGIYSGTDLSKASKKERKAFDAFLEETRLTFQKSFLLKEVSDDGAAFALILAGRYRGFGTLEDTSISDIHEVEKILYRAPETSTAKAVVRRMMMDKNVIKYEIEKEYSSI